MGYTYDRVIEEFRDEWSFVVRVCKRGTFLFSMVFFEFILVGGGMVSGGVSERGCCVLLNRIYSFNFIL